MSSSYSGKLVGLLPTPLTHIFLPDLKSQDTIVLFLRVAGIFGFPKFIFILFILIFTFIIVCVGMCHKCVDALEARRLLDPLQLEIDPASYEH